MLAASGIGRIVAGMSRQGFDLDLVHHGADGWKATFYPAGRTAHSQTSAVGSGWAPAPWVAVQRAAWEGLRRREGEAELSRSPTKGLTYDAGAPAYDSFTGRWSVAFAPALLTAAGVTVGQTILEVAAGTGGLTVQAVSAVSTSGRVIATDLSLPMLRVAKGKIAGFPVDLVVMDGQDLACRDRSVDVVICQLGLMFFPDATRGLQEFRRVLRRYGRVAVQVWSWPDRVSYFGVLADALSRYFPDQREVLYSPAALADPDRLEQLLATAGFEDVSVARETREVAFQSFDEYWSGIEAGGGRLGQFYLDLPDVGRRAVRDEVSGRMAKFESNGRLVLKAEALIGTGINASA